MNHNQARDLLPGYALGALAVAEQEELTEHLRSCAACHQLAQEQVEVGAMLASQIAVADPPQALKSRILTSVAELSMPP